MEKRKNLVLAKIAFILLKVLRILCLVVFILGLVASLLLFIGSILAIANYVERDPIYLRTVAFTYMNKVISSIMWSVVIFLVRFPLGKLITILSNYKDGKPYNKLAVDNIKNVAFWILGLGVGVMSISLISFMINCIQNITMGAANTIIINFIFNMPELIKDVILIAAGVFSLLILSMVLKNRPIEE